CYSRARDTAKSKYPINIPLNRPEHIDQPTGRGPPNPFRSCFPSTVRQRPSNILPSLHLKSVTEPGQVEEGLPLQKIFQNLSTADPEYQPRNVRVLAP